MKNLELNIRNAQISDLKELQEMFVDTIESICKDHYSLEQINVWTSSIENTQRWLDKLSSHYFIVAEIDNKILGFASLDNNNLDLLYIHKNHQRQGIANRLYTEILKEAVNRNATILNSEVSETARPFFEKKGFKTIEPQTLLIKGIEITNYKMTKLL